MPTAGKGVLLASGKRGLLAGGKAALFGAAGTCAACCEEPGACDCLYTDFAYAATFDGSMSAYDGTYYATGREDGKIGRAHV